MFALVSGANRGIGLEVVRQLATRGDTVILGARDLASGESARQSLGDLAQRVIVHPLDVTNPTSVAQIRDFVLQKWGKLDALVNNAGGFYDAQQRASTADLALVREALELNLLGAWALCEAFLPLLRKSDVPRIVNVSSEAGSFGGSYFGIVAGDGSVPAYAVSKAALTAFTVKLAKDLQGTGILVNAVCPGWTATQEGMADMGARPVSEGAAGIVWAATLPANGPSGGFFRDGQPLPW